MQKINVLSLLIDKPFSQSLLSIIEADLSSMQVIFQTHSQHAPGKS